MSITFESTRGTVQIELHDVTLLLHSIHTQINHNVENLAFWMERVMSTTDDKKRELYGKFALRYQRDNQELQALVTKLNAI